MLVAAAICPHPPALIPELGGTQSSDLDVVRSAAVESVEALCAADPEQLIVIGGGTGRRAFEAGSRGTFADYGADRQVALPGKQARTDTVPMPLPFLVGAWLLERANWMEPARGEQVPSDAPVDECLSIGAELAENADRVGLLVMGDGAVGRTHDAPRPYDPRAETFDRDVKAALQAADPAALSRLDGALAAELDVAGRAPWHVLAGAVGDAMIDADVLYDGAPYGVGYVVAVWERHG